MTIQNIVNGTKWVDADVRSEIVPDFVVGDIVTNSSQGKVGARIMMVKNDKDISRKTYALWREQSKTTFAQEVRR